jgi:hypothetical protein
MPNPSIEIPPDPPFSKGGMFCCFRKLAGMRSFPAYDPKIASEYLPLYQTPKYLPLSQRPKYLPLSQRGPGGFTDRPKKTPNTSPFRKNLKYLPLSQKPQISPPFVKGAGGIFTVGKGYKPCFHTTPDSNPPARVLRRTMTDAERLL